VTAQNRLTPHLEKIAGVKDKKKLAKDIAAATKHLRFVPWPGPQTDAYLSKADELFYGGAAGGGKRLDIDTEIPTISGWTKMGDLQPGDMVFSVDGSPTRVTAVSKIEPAPRSFEVVFDTGEVIYADGEHLWTTMDAKERMAAQRLTDEYREKRKANRVSRAVAKSKKPWVSKAITAINQAREYEYLEPPTGSVRTTDEIRKTLLVGKRVNHSVAVAGALELPHARLPIEPYLLGLWLGDGTSASGAIGMADYDIDEVIGYTNAPLVSRIACGKERKTPYIIARFKGLHTKLRESGLLSNKHIPLGYFRASRAQRLALLQGIMDTDGHCDIRGQCELTLSKRNLIEDVHHLVSSLGIKATITEKPVKRGNTAYRLKFVSAEPVFRLKRKLVRQKLTDHRETTRRRYIVDVRPCEPRMMRCIAVDHPSRLYLVGPTCIPTHNTAMLVGLAVQAHTKSIIFRREYSQIRGLEDEAAKLLGARDGYNATEKVWRHSGGRVLEFGSVPHEWDREKYQGRAHSFIGFDEITHFTPSIYRYLIGWNRSDVKGERCRVVVTGNPPTTAEGRWVVEYWAPWLDPNHPNPAKPGELRWFTTIKGEDVELPGPDPIEVDGRVVTPRSRTFIAAKLEDNPALMDSGYAAVLESMPEPLRTMMREGRFDLGQQDDDFQVIPSAWVDQAMSRWSRQRPDDPMTSMGVDVAQGGADETVISRRHGSWFDEIIARKGIDTKDGPAVAGLIVQYMRDGCEVNIDTGGGWGGSAFDHLKHQNVKIRGVLGSSGSSAKTKDRQLGFINKRAETWWKLREALDPNFAKPVALPPDPQLRADLCSPRWKLVPRGIQIESKDDIRKRLGRSPDRGDAVVLAWVTASESNQVQPAGRNFLQKKAVLGYSKIKKVIRR
jgi:hypothetical protein